MEGVIIGLGGMAGILIAAFSLWISVNTQRSKMDEKRDDERTSFLQLQLNEQSRRLKHVEDDLADCLSEKRAIRKDRDNLKEENFRLYRRVVELENGRH